MDDKQVEKIQSVIADVKRDYCKLAEKIATLEQLAASQPTLGQQVKELHDYWFEMWKAAYNDKYQFAQGRDASQFKHYLKALGLEELEARLARFLDDKDPWIVGQRHLLGIFFARVNSYGRTEAPALVEATRPIGCRHTPACKSDAAHTRRMLAEKRA